MTDSSRKTIQFYIAIILSVLAILGAIGSYGTSRARDAVTRQMVEEHDDLLKANNLEVIVTNQDNMSEDVKEIKADIKDLSKAFNEYMRTHP